MGLIRRTHTAEEAAVIHVELALQGFTGIFDNDYTRIREVWYRGRLAVKVTAMYPRDLPTLWCVNANPEHHDEDTSRDIIQNLGTQEERRAAGIE